MVATERQILGFISVVALALIIYGLSLATPDRPGGVGIPAYSDLHTGGLVVELTGQIPFTGIYFLPLGSDLGDLSLAARLVNIQTENNADLKLQRGDRYRVENGYLVKSGEMRPQKKMLLGLTLDINEATEADLLLIPRIGPKTAREIIRFRQERGKIGELEELQNIKGIKDKRLALLRQYLHAGELAGEARFSVGPRQ